MLEIAFNDTRCNDTRRSLTRCNHTRCTGLVQSHKMHSHICLLNPSRLSTQSISTQSISPFPIRATSIFSLGYEMGSGGVVWQRMAYTLKEWRIPSRLVLFISFSYTVYISLRVHTYRVHINLRVHTTPQSRPISSMRMNTKVTECARAARRC